MARTVDEIMNRELFSLRPSEPVEGSVDYLLALGLTAAPVVDRHGAPVGFISIADVLGRKKGTKVSDRMTSPAMSVPVNATIEGAAHFMAQRDLRHVPVVDREGRAVGIVSLIDIIKALLGLPVGHPAAFPHYDRRTGLVWSDDMLLAPDTAEVAPDGPGLLVLVQGGAGSRETVVWVESCENVRARVYELLEAPRQPPYLATVLARHGLRFRTASAPDVETRRAALGSLLQDVGLLPATQG